MASRREGQTIAKKQLILRETLWGKGIEAWLWNRNLNKGFATIPKTMPWILQIMDDLSNGKPVSTTYLGLWCETWDNSMVNASRQAQLAYAAGFSGQRAVYTWQGRVQILQDLKFIDVKPGASGKIGSILIWNPHVILRMHHSQKTLHLDPGKYAALMERASEIGANDMLEQWPETPSPETTASTPAAADPPVPASTAEGAAGS